MCYITPASPASAANVCRRSGLTSMHARYAAEVLAYFDFIIRNFPLFPAPLLRNRRRRQRVNEGRQAREGKGGCGGGGGIYWSSTQNVNKALAKDLSLVVSALTPRRLGRNALVIHRPRIGSAPLALPPRAPPLYRRGHCSRGSFVPFLDFWRSPPPFSGHPGRDPLCSQATAGSPQTAARPGDQAEVTPSRLPFQARHHRCLSV